MRVALTVFAFGLMSVPMGCSKRATVQSPSQPQLRNTPGAGPTNGVDACSLLTSADIESVQGVAVKATKPSLNSQGGVTVSQCYFLLPTAADSIVLTVTQKSGGADARDPKEAWSEIFRSAKEAGSAPAEQEKEKQSAPPQQISDLGDEAFWAPQRFGGALYVLKSDIYISLSIGGPADQATKLQKSKVLAEMVLKRL